MIADLKEVVKKSGKSKDKMIAKALAMAQDDVAEAEEATKNEV